MYSVLHHLERIGLGCTVHELERLVEVAGPSKVPYYFLLARLEVVGSILQLVPLVEVEKPQHLAEVGSSARLTAIP